MVQMVKDLNGPDGIVTLTYTTLFEYRSDLYAPFISYIQRTTFKANFSYTTSFHCTPRIPHSAHCSGGLKAYSKRKFKLTI